MGRSWVKDLTRTFLFKQPLEHMFVRPCRVLPNLRMISLIIVSGELAVGKRLCHGSILSMVLVDFYT
jgi:hypothetical protein